MDTLLQLFNQFQAYSKANPIVAGAVSLWGLGVVTFMFRSIPFRIWNFIKRQSTTTLQFNSDTLGTNLQTFTGFMKWFEKEGRSRWSRQFALQGVYTYGGNPEDGTVMGMGDGSHFFFYKGRPVWLNRRRIEQTGFNVVYEITITTLGRSRAPLDRMIDEFKYRPSADKIGVFQLSEKQWVRIADIEKRPLQTVVLDKQTKQQLVSWIEEWQKSREWYETRGLPYKMTFVFHGIPGTGKTSLIRALASHFQMNLCVINITSISDSALEQALATTPPKTIIVIEDFDSSGATKARKNVPAVKPADPAPAAAPSGGWTLTKAAETPKDAVPVAAGASGEDKGDSLADLLGGFGALSLTGLLNALDGVISLNGKLVFMTTNVFDQMDSALVRKGRIDHAIEIKAATHAEVVEYIELMFPDADTSCLPAFADIVGCDLQALYFEYRNDYRGFIDALPKKGFTPVLVGPVAEPALAEA